MRKKRVIHPEIKDGRIAIGFNVYEVRDHEVIGLHEKDPAFSVFRTIFSLQIQTVKKQQTGSSKKAPGKQVQP